MIEGKAYAKVIYGPFDTPDEAQEYIDELAKANTDGMIHYAHPIGQYGQPINIEDQT